MKKHLMLCCLLAAPGLWAQDNMLTTSSVATPTAVTPTVLAKWDAATVPWDAWFKDNALVTDKTDYVHFFWNAQDFRGNFEGKDKKIRLAEAALALVQKLTPADAKADLMKVDIVYVLERDSYGQPKWDSLQQVAHLEFKKSKAPKGGKGKGTLTATALKKIFVKFDLF